MDGKFSVLMSLYYKENPQFLKESLTSIFSQSLPPTEVVLVEDGPLTKELYEVLDFFSSTNANFKRIKLLQNVGLGQALNEGLKVCQCEIVARMDTDDICCHDRFIKQITFLKENPDVDLCGSWVSEFIESKNNICSIRKVPVSNIEIKHFIKSRNPFNHPTVVFRKRMVEQAGGYQHFYLLEDWYLWARMFSCGAKMYNIQEPLLYFRTSPDVHKRRGGLKYAKACTQLFHAFKELNIITGYEFYKYSLIKGCVAILPNFLRGFIYNNFLRSKP